MIDSDEALEYLAFHLEWDSEPKLSNAKQERLLLYARAVDVNGVSPGGEDYVETYSFDSLHATLIRGAEWKVASAAELHEDDSYKIFDHWEKTLARWRGMWGSIEIGGTSSESGSFAIPNVAVF